MRARRVEQRAHVSFLSGGGQRAHVSFLSGGDPVVVRARRVVQRTNGVAVRDRAAPKGQAGYLGITPVQISDASSDEEIAPRAVAHMFGLVEECEGAREAHERANERTNERTNERACQAAGHG